MTAFTLRKLKENRNKPRHAGLYSVIEARRIE